MSNIYILLGVEKGEKQDHINKIVKNFKDKDTEVLRFFADEDNIENFRSFNENMSMFSSKKLTYFYKAESIKKKDFIYIEDILKKIDKDTVIIFISEENKIKLQELKKNIMINEKVFYELNFDKRLAFANEFLSKNMQDIDQEALILFINTIENDTLIIKNECTKLINLNKEKIIIDDILQYFTFTKEVNVFNLFTFIMEKNLQEILNSLSYLLKGNIIFLIIALISELEKALNIFLLYKEEDDLERVLLKSKVFFFKKNDYRNMIKNYSVEEIEYLLNSLFFFDLEFRKDVKLAKIKLELFFARLFKKDYYLKPHDKKVFES